MREILQKLAVMSNDDLCTARNSLKGRSSKKFYDRKKRITMKDWARAIDFELSSRGMLAS